MMDLWRSRSHWQIAAMRLEQRVGGITLQQVEKEDQVLLHLQGRHQGSSPVIAKSPYVLP